MQSSSQRCSRCRWSPGLVDVRFNYHTDALGSVVAMTSEGGTVVASYRYGAFGELVSVGGTNAELAARNPLRFRWSALKKREWVLSPYAYKMQ